MEPRLDIDDAQVWRFYILVQISQASLGLIPEGVIGINFSLDKIDPCHITLRFVLDKDSAVSRALAFDIYQNFEGSTLDDSVGIDFEIEIAERVVVVPGDGITWTYIAIESDGYPD